MKYEVLQNFQFIDDKHQIQILEAGDFVNQYDKDLVKFKIKNKEYTLPLTLIQNNPQFFKKSDWKVLLTDHMKENKRKTQAAILKQVIEFLEKELFKEQQLVDFDTMQDLLQLAMERYNASGEKKWIDLFDKLGWNFDQQGNIFRKF